MADDNLELVDREYGECPREEYPRQIKTRKASFNSILQRFTNFRIKRLQAKLGRMEKDSLTSQYFQSNPEGALEKKSKTIARIEEKIKVLSKEDVPSDYVRKRAIKLKKRMIENLHKNANNLYSIGMSKRDAIFGEEVPNVPVEEEDVVEENEIDVTGDELDRKTIEDSINAEFSNISKEQDSSQVVEDELNRRAIEDSINAEFSNINKDNEIEEYTEKEGKGLTAKEIEDIINSTFDRMHQQQETPAVEPAIGYEINKENNTMDNNEEKDEQVRISRNKASSARLFRYDRDGSDLKEYDYVPMTDEEIRIAQRKIGLDENGNFIRSPKELKEKKVGTATIVQKEIPSIVIPKIKLEDILIPPKENNYTFREKPVVIRERQSEPQSKEIDDYTALREKILYLKQQRELTRKQKEDAQRTAEETAERARQIREMFEESQKNYAQSIDMLKAYEESLEEACSSNLQGTRAAEDDTRKNNDFISSHREKMDYNNRIINEIDSLIGNPENSTAISGRR